MTLSLAIEEFSCDTLQLKSPNRRMYLFLLTVTVEANIFKGSYYHLESSTRLPKVPF